MGTGEYDCFRNWGIYQATVPDSITNSFFFAAAQAEITADELEAMGYTISEDRTTASKDATLAKITYTFDKLPATLEELKEFSLKSDVQGDYDYGIHITSDNK